jgi:hypothetical protein
MFLEGEVAEQSGHRDVALLGKLPNKLKADGINRKCNVMDGAFDV